MEVGAIIAQPHVVTNTKCVGREETQTQGREQDLWCRRGEVCCGVASRNAAAEEERENVDLAKAEEKLRRIERQHPLPVGAECSVDHHSSAGALATV